MASWRRGGVGVLAVIGLMGSACSGGGSEDPDASEIAPVVEPVGRLLADVDGIGAVYAGTVEDDDLDVTAEESSLVAPRTRGVVAVGEGLAVEVSGPFTGEFEIRLQLPTPPSEDAVPAVIHVADDDTVTVEPGLFDPVTNEIVVAATSFSDRFGAWYDPRNWVEEVVQAGQGAFDFVADFVTGRTDPPACRNNPPPWASSATLELSALHVCTQSNPAEDGAERFEMYLASNRATAQVVTVPTGGDYLWVDNQPEALRRALAAFAGVDPGSNIVLLGGHALSIGFRQPLFSTDFDALSYQTWPVIVANPLLALLGNLPLEGTIALVVATNKCISEFTGFDITRADIVPDEFGSPAEFLGQMVRCGFELLQHPELVASTADEILRPTGMTVVDRNNLVGAVRNGADRVAPTAVRIAGAVAVGTTAVNALDGIFDNLAAGSVTVNLEGTLSDEALSRLASCSNCTVSGRVDIDHPTWGRTHIISFDPPGDSCGGIELIAIDDSGVERWRHTVDPECYYQLTPAGAGDYGSEVPGPVDAAGRIFFDWNPGRYNGVLVLSPTAEGFETYDTLPSLDRDVSYDVRFYYADATDTEGDGIYEIRTYYTTCYPDCAGSPRSETILRFIDNDFQAIPPASPQLCGGEWIDVTTNDVAHDITATGIICRDAVNVVNEIGERYGSAIGPTSVEVSGFTCVVSGQYTDEYSCERGGATITFERYEGYGD